MPKQDLCVVPIRSGIPKSGAAAVAGASGGVGPGIWPFGDRVCGHPIDVGEAGELIAGLLLERQRIDQAIRRLRGMRAGTGPGKREQRHAMDPGRGCGPDDAA